jgi:hypothetical protein
MKLFEDGDPCFAPMLNALFAAFRGTAVMSGCEASATGTSRTVSITAGSVQIGGVEVAVGAGSVTLDVGSSFDRYDLISVNATGSKIVTKGVAKRKCPPQPTGTCLLAIVFVPAGATVIATGDVYDARMLSQNLAAAAIECAGTIAANSLILSESPFTIVPDPTKNAKYLMKSSDSEVAGSMGGWTLAKSLPPLPASVFGTENSVYVSYQHKSSHASFTTWTQIYVNGVAVGTQRSNSSTSYTTWDEVITGLKAGDIIQIYSQAGEGEGEYPYVRNLRVYGVIFQTIPMTPGIW